MAAEPWVGIKTAVISVAAVQTDAEVVAAVTGKRIRVLSYLFTVGATGATVLFESGTATALTGTMDFDTSDLVAHYAGGVYAPAFETAIGEALTLTNTGALANVEGHLTYQEV